MDEDPRPTIVIVDDDSTNLKILEKLLGEEGYEVLTFPNGQAALDHLQVERPDLVIADWEMPELSGIDLCRRIRSDSHLDTLYVLLLTSNTETADMVVGLEAGADDYIGKPFKRQELLARVRAGLRIGQMQRKITQRAAVEAQRDRLQKALEALQQVLSMVGHELRTPLASIRALSEFHLTAQIPGDDEMLDFAKTINFEVVKMSEMVNNMLDLISLESGQHGWHWEAIDLSRLCQQAVDQICNCVDPDQVTVTCDVSPIDLSLQGDARSIRRLLDNLLTNAATHTHDGVISVVARPTRIGDESAIAVTVSDTGEGIADHLLERLGQSFALSAGFYGSNYIQGSGFGLALCRLIADAHGGKISVTSEEYVGTTFTVTLKAELAEPEKARAVIKVLGGGNDSGQDTRR